MSFNCSSRNYSSRPMGGRCTVPMAPAATSAALETDCLSNIHLPSSFQTGSWLLDHCQESSSCEPAVCQPTCFQRTSCISSPAQVTCSRQTTCVSSPCSSSSSSRPFGFVSSGCQPLGGISSVCQPVGSISTVCQPVGGVSSICQPSCGYTRTYQQSSCVSSCRRTC
ncbi:keratin-associated protein 11-1-like [Ochotona curzoniae]|uniref:keratin-associated protein 11-1 n=1 Tax=Ochotona curzoniae TaxID=130825 RepID=UPI001B34AE2A|nr:keratin-associated protein 11-1 [Ochotona curzoniae]XP_040852540.1 keratin-associated protein 11-1-like [Ochotona curzoniae]